MGRTKRIAAGIALTVLLATLGASSVAARPIEDYGATFNCHYRTIEGTFPAMGDLRRIVVTPPILFGDRSEQTVGWRLIVRRYLNDEDTGDVAVATWRSRIKTAITYQGVQAELSRIVFWPSDLPDSSRWDSSGFEASIRLIWYAPDGSIERTVLHPFASVYTYVDGELWWHTWDPACTEPRQLEFVDGPF